MKNLTVVFVCLLLLVPCLAAENQSAQDSKSPQQLEIEKYISQLKGQIEYYYQVRLIELNQRAQAEIGILEVTDKAVNAASLAGQAQVAKAVLGPWYVETENGRTPLLKSQLLPYDEFTDKLATSPGRFAAAQGQIAERKSWILAQLARETLDLQQQKEYALNVRLPEIEKQLKEDTAKPQPEATDGLVTGILYSQDRPAALVDHKIVHNGEVINGVTVVSISNDRVAFEKSGKKWEQKVQQKPESYWK